MLLIFLVLHKDKIDESGINRQHQRLGDDFQDVGYRDNIEVLPNQKLVKTLNMEINKVESDSTKRELMEAKARIEQLEKKIAVLEGRIPQKYPEVEYLGFKERKRILVC